MILSTYPDNHNFQGYIVSYKDHLGIAIVSLLLGLIIKSIAF